jgi:hypothetical protein
MSSTKLRKVGLTTVLSAHRLTGARQGADDTRDDRGEAKAAADQPRYARTLGSDP